MNLYLFYQKDIMSYLSSSKVPGALKTEMIKTSSEGHYG